MCKTYCTENVVKKKNNTCASNTKVYKICTLCMALFSVRIFLIQHFATELRNYTNFSTLFLAVVIHFLLVS